MFLILHETKNDKKKHTVFQIREYMIIYIFDKFVNSYISLKII